ncbi:MAG: FecR domain-containing protein [Devosia sp.]
MRVGLIVLGAVALMATGARAETVGVAAAVNQSATGVAPGSAMRTLTLGDQIIHDEQIVTNNQGLLQILLADGSSFTVGPNSSLKIDSFVYDPNANSAKLVATVGTGVFRFIGGVASKAPGGVEINTPVGTVGIRGGISNLDFSGAKPFHIDMVYGVGVTLSSGQKIIGNLYHSGYSIVIDPNGKAGVLKTPPEWSAQFQIQMAGSNSGNVNGNKVAGALGNTNKTKAPKEEKGDGKTASAGDHLGPVATWGQINNSDLKNVTARYDGTYSADLTYTGPSTHVPASSTINNNPFALVYSFADRSGTTYFGLLHTGDPVPSPTNGSNVTLYQLVHNTSGHGYHLAPYQVFIPSTASLTSIKIDVDSPAGRGFATFGTSTTTGGALATTAEVNGLFLNTDAGVAQAVAGTVDTSVTILGNTFDLNGAFAGNLTSTTPPTP